MAINTKPIRELLARSKVSVQGGVTLQQSLVETNRAVTALAQALELLCNEIDKTDDHALEQQERE